MTVRRRVVKGLLVVCCILILSGCWDRREIEERTSVVALAVDKHEQGIQVTIQVPIPIKIVGSGGGGGGDGGQGAVQLFTASGQDLTDAFKNVQKQLNNELDLGQMQLVVISEALARDGLEDITDALQRMHQVRRRLWPVVVEGKAEKALVVGPQLEQIPAFYLIDMLQNDVKQKRLFDFNLGAFLSNLMDEAENPVLNLYRVTDKTIDWNGLALFRGDRMVGQLGEAESWTLVQIRDGRPGFRESFPCPDGGEEELTFELRHAKRTVTFSEQPFKFRVHIDTEGVIVEETCGTDLSKEKNRETVERGLKQVFERRADRTIRNIQQSNTDVTKLGTHIRAYYPAVWRHIDWQEKFPTTDVDVTYTVRITGTGAKFR